MFVFVPCALTKNLLPFSSKANNDIIAFLSGMPVTRNTRYLDLKNAVSFCLCGGIDCAKVNIVFGFFLSSKNVGGLI